MNEAILSNFIKVNDLCVCVCVCVCVCLCVCVCVCTCDFNFLVAIAVQREASLKTWEMLLNDD